MPRGKRDVEAGLSGKGFRRDSRDHRVFIHYSFDGRRTAVRTKTSHGTSTRTIGDDLLSQMARQCHLSRGDFLRLIDCPMSRDEYEDKLRTANLI